MRIQEYLRARRRIENWQHFFDERKVMLPPDKPARTKIRLRNGLVINARVGTADLTAIMGVFLKSYYKGMKDSYGVVVDVGAHIGCFTLLAAGRADHVYAIEPMPDNFELLEANLFDNGIKNVTARCAAMSGTQGETTLFCHDTHSDSHTTVSPGDNAPAGRSLTVPTVTIGSMMSAYNIDRIDMMKMDCEGAEYDILFALSVEEAARIGEIFLEYHASSDPRRNYRTLHELLESLGFFRDWLRKGRHHGYAHYLRA